MKKIIFFIFIMPFYIICNGQNSNNIDCNFLQKSFDSDIFYKNFLLNKDNKNEVIVIDTFNQTQTCTILSLNHESIKYLHDLPKVVTDKQILIIGIENKKNITLIAFLNRRSNVALSIEYRYKWKKNKIKMKVVSKGVF